MEGFIAELFGRVGANANGAVDDAQEMMYDAWEASGAERVALARAALDISPLCADAYVLLAEEEAGSQQDALSLYRHGVEAGRSAERRVGKECVSTCRSRWWPYHKTQKNEQHDNTDK